MAEHAAYPAIPCGSAASTGLCGGQMVTAVPAAPLFCDAQTGERPRFRNYAAALAVEKEKWLNGMRSWKASSFAAVKDRI
jgi:hypothetical protein